MLFIHLTPLFSVLVHWQGTTVVIGRPFHAQHKRGARQLQLGVPVAGRYGRLGPTTTSIPHVLRFPSITGTHGRGLTQRSFPSTRTHSYLTSIWNISLIYILRSRLIGPRPSYAVSSVTPHALFSFNIHSVSPSRISFLMFDPAYVSPVPSLTFLFLYLSLALNASVSYIPALPLSHRIIFLQLAITAV